MAMCFMRSPISRFHDSRATAGDDTEIIFCQEKTECPCFLVPFVAFDKARGSEKSDCFSVSQISKKRPAINELSHDTENAPVKRCAEITRRCVGLDEFER